MVKWNCPVCGKEFYPTPMWVYKDGKNVYCSYHCYLRSGKVKKKNAKSYRPVEQLTLEGEFVREYWCVSEAADDMDVEYYRIQRACAKGKPCKGYLWRYKENAMS
jgi:hypothetical protein